MSWIVLFVFGLVRAQNTPPPIVTDCSTIPTGSTHDPFSTIAQPEVQNTVTYKTTCNNLPVSDNPGMCLAFSAANTTLYDYIPATYVSQNPPVRSWLGPFQTTYNFPCTQCVVCDCPTDNYRGGLFGQCCGDASGGPGCICPRRSLSICLGLGGVSAGGCATTAFPLAADVGSALAVTTAGIARARGLTGLAAKTSYIGVGDDDILMLGIIVASAFCPSVYAGGGNLFKNKYASPSSNPFACRFSSGAVIYSPAIRYNAQFGTIASSDVLGNTVCWTVFQSGNQVASVGVQTCDSSPGLQGFFITAFDASAGIWDVSNGIQIFYRVTPSVAPLIGFAAGTVMKVISTPYQGTCNAGSGQQCGYMIVSAADSDPNLSRISAAYMSTEGYALDNAPKLSSFLVGGGVSVWAWAAAVVSRPNKNCNGGPPQVGPIFLKGFSAYLAGTTQSQTELIQCQGDWGACNGPVSMTWVPGGTSGLSAIQVDPNYNPPADSSVVPVPGSGTRYMTIHTIADGTSLVTVEPGVNGQPGPNQLGFYWFGAGGAFVQLPFVRLVKTAGNSAYFSPNDHNPPGTVYCVSENNGLCEIWYLTTNLGQCYQFSVALLGPPPVDIADCNTCTDCVCDSVLAERGDGSLCCPPFRAGYQCLVNTDIGCTSRAAGQLCSGNGNNTYPGNLNGTGCYFNNATAAYQCSCLPGYVPPYCLSRYATTCGSPICNGRGNCTDDEFEFDSAVCYCDSGYRGAQCQFPVVECFSALGQPVCSGHGQCEDPDTPGFATPTCICDNGYAGVFCEQALSEDCLDNVSGQMCTGRGLCVPGVTCTLPFPAVQHDSPCTNCSLAFGFLSGFGVAAVGGSVVLDGPATAIMGNLLVTGSVTVSFLNQGHLNGTKVIDNYLVGNVTAALAVLQALPCTTTIAPAQTLSGTFGPGVYCGTLSENLIEVGGSVILDGRNQINPVFVFRVDNGLDFNDNTQVILINGAVPTNVYWVSTQPSTEIFIGQKCIVQGIVAAPDVSCDVGSEVLGALVLTGAGEVLLKNAVAVATVPVPLPFPCTAPATSLDICNATGMLDFCASRVGNPKKLLTTDPVYQQQTFTLAELECLSNNFSIARGFAVLNNFANLCVVELQVTVAYFQGEFSSQFDNLQPCLQTVQRSGSLVRVYIPSPSRAYEIQEYCYSTSLISTAPDNLKGAFKEALVTGVRVGDFVGTPLGSRQRLASECEKLAKARRSPYWGVDSAFGRCFLPGVLLPTVSSPPEASLNIYPNFVYRVDIDNELAHEFWITVTRL